MIFAAGLGTRMGALTATRPKPLIEVGGVPLLDRALALADAAGIGRLVVNSHYLADQIGRHLAPRPDIAISHEPQLLDTGGGLRAALPLLGPGPVVTLNPDVVWAGPNPLPLLHAAWRPGMGALLLLVPAARAVGRVGTGDFVLHPDGRLTRPGPMIYTGAEIIDPLAAGPLPEGAFSLNLLWNRLIAAGRAFGLVYPGRWCDVGRPEGIALAEAMLAEAAEAGDA